MTHLRLIARNHAASHHQYFRRVFQAQGKQTRPQAVWRYACCRTALDVQIDSLWLLLIYTVPAEPTRKRAAIWRDIKKIGAIYLRDGVCVLPERPETITAMRAIAAKVDGFDGQATLVEAARLDSARTAMLVAESRMARAAEYADIAREAEQLLAHVARETEHRDFTFGELEELEEDLGKVKRWTAQVQARDYFGNGLDARLVELLDQCERALAVFLEEAARRAETTPR